MQDHILAEAVDSDEREVPNREELEALANSLVDEAEYVLTQPDYVGSADHTSRVMLAAATALRALADGDDQ